MRMWDWFKWPFFAFLIVFVFFWLLIRIHLLIQMKKTGLKPVKAVKRKVSTSFFKKVFYQFPKMMAFDILHRNPNAFPYRGIIIFEGPQGNGKSISLVEFATRMKMEYPESKCTANLGYVYRDDHLDDWRKLTSYNNGELGVVAIIDETQNWFSSKDSKDFPPEMLSVVTQNRKNRRIILGTAQNFYMLSKDIRTQCTEVRSCFTIFGCVTFVVRKVPVCDSTGEVVKWKYRGMYWYVHTPELRESYNTYEVIDRLSKTGFVSKIERYGTDESLQAGINAMMKQFI